MKIEFGCGLKPRKSGWKYQDVRDLKGIDYVCDVWDIKKHVADSSVDAVFSRHMFEHLTFFHGKKTLIAWHEILKDGGICEIILPNMDFHVNQWLTLQKNNFSNKEVYDHAVAGFWGWQCKDKPEENTNFWDCHKSGYNFKTLSDLLYSVGFKNIKSVLENTSPHLHIKCTK